MKKTIINILRFLNKEKYYLIISIIIGVIFTSKIYADNLQKGISEKVIRFHVLANSDSANDQMLKLMVRDAVLERFEKELKISGDVSQTREILNNNLLEIKAVADGVIKQQGYNYSTKVYLASENFPTRKYGDITLPSGDYETLRIDIGGGEGHNWWCVMFPPLCYVDVSSDTVPIEEKMKIKEQFGKEEFEAVTEDSYKVNYKFKIAEIWE